MNAFLIAVLLQSSLSLPPRTAMENPAAVSPIPQKIKKDYDKIWARFLTGKEAAKVLKDLDKILKKQKTFDPALTIEGYVHLFKGDDAAAREKFTAAVALNATNRIALYYLAELAYLHKDYGHAASLYSELAAVDKAPAEVEMKRQSALLRATDDLLRSAAQAEAENRLAQAEQSYRQALTIVPNDPTLHSRLADLLAKEGKIEEAEAQRKTVIALTPVRAGRERANDIVKGDDLEDLGRWGNDIEIFHRIRDAVAINREQFAALVVRYFPQVTEFRQKPQIVTDIQDSWASAEIQTIVGIGLIPPLPNHTFEPAAPVTRGDVAAALARLSRLLQLPPSPIKPVAASDVVPTNPRYTDVQLVLGYGVMTLENSGSFNLGGYVSGGEAIRSTERLLRTFQQAQR